MQSIRHTALALCMFCMTGAFAQIYINTGNPNMDKYKNADPNATIMDSQNGGTSTPTKATTKVRKSTSTPITLSSSSSETMTSGSSSNYTGNLNEANNNLPSNAEPGKCYARCFVPDQYDFKEEMVIDRPASYRTQSVPATYRTVFDTVVVRAASMRYQDIPAVYETTVEDIMVSPASQKWVKSFADAGCLSANPSDCQVMCLQDVPAVYKKVSRRIVKTPGYKQEIPLPAETKIVSRQIIESPASTTQTEIPATYKKLMHKELTRKGGYSDWREILCASKLTTSKIISIQRALKAAGYDPGPIDDVFGSQTKTALVKYQQDKSLPTGNLNMETLRALGVE
jgi:Putative peptidoglycan binding domain